MAGHVRGREPVEDHPVLVQGFHPDPPRFIQRDVAPEDRPIAGIQTEKGNLFLLEVPVLAHKKEV
jgi:hypothetical protein